MAVEEEEEALIPQLTKTRPRHQSTRTGRWSQHHSELDHSVSESAIHLSVSILEAQVSIFLLLLLEEDVFQRHSLSAPQRVAGRKSIPIVFLSSAVSGVAQ